MCGGTHLPPLNKAKRKEVNKMTGSDNGQDEGEARFREAYRAYIERRGRISERTRKLMVVGKKGNYQGPADWSPEDKKWVEGRKARLNRLVVLVKLAADRRKEIEGDVNRETV